MHKIIMPRHRTLIRNAAASRIEHEPTSTQCACGCTLHRIGEDIVKPLNYPYTR